MSKTESELQQLQVRDGAKIGFRLAKNELNRCVIGMVHGLASNKTRWDEFIDKTCLRKIANLMAFDLRGHNDSLWHGRITRSKWARDMYDIFKAKQFDKVFMIGHSMGAQVVMQYAMQHRDLVNGLILIDPIFDKNLTGNLVLARRTRYILWTILLVVWFFNLLGFRKRKFKFRSLYELDIATRQYLAENPHQDIAELYMSPVEDMKYMPLANYIQDILEVIRPVGPIDSIDCPVLVLLSKRPAMSNLQKNVEIIKTIPNSQIHYIEADHWLMTEKPDEARQVMEDWLQSQLNTNENQQRSQA
ncbi:MAG: alpha/beta hydrolase [Gammaproteobacteria bacterium]|nr:alpha/beta hydrolase [Gammaproteobacteria bacterium]